MSKKVVIRINNPQSIERAEDSSPREVIVYHWRRIFGVLSIALVLLAGLIWAGRHALKTSGETPLVPRPDEAASALVAPSAQLPAGRAAAAGPPVAAMAPKRGETKTPEAPRKPLAVAPKQAGTVADTGLPRAPISILSRSVKRVLLTSKVIEDEPVDTLGTVIPMNDKGLIRVYLFMETAGLKGQVLFHDWYWNGKRMAHARIPIGRNTYKAASSKFIDRIMMGPWEVKVVDERGKVLGMAAFEVR